MQTLVRLLVFTLLISPVCLGQNLLVNGDLEDWNGNTPVGWEVESAATVTKETSPVQSGSYSAGLQATSNTNAGITQSVQVIGGEPYTFQAYLYSTSGTGSKGIGLFISWYDSDNKNISSSNPQYATYTGDWEFATTGEVTAPDNAVTARCRLRCYADNTFGGYVDNAAFYYGGGPTPTPGPTSTPRPTSTPWPTPTGPTPTPPPHDYIPIHEIQYTTDESGDSPYKGQTVTTYGIVYAFQPDNPNIFIQDGEGPWSGILVYTHGAQVALGDAVLVTGTIKEHYGLTEFDNGATIEILSTGNPLPNPAVLQTNDVGFEEWESVFVRVENVTITNANLGNGEWQINDGSGPIRVHNEYFYTFLPVLNMQLDYVQGPLTYSYENFKIEPRNDNDIAEPPPTPTPTGPTPTPTPFDTIPIRDIQFTTDPSGDSPYANQIVNIQGIVTGAKYNGYYVADDAGPWNAVYVFNDLLIGPQVGDEVRVRGKVTEYYNLTEIVDVTYSEIISHGNPIVSTTVSAGEFAEEAYESVLVTVEGDLSVVSLDSYGQWTVSDGSDTMSVDDEMDYNYFPKRGDSLSSITGIVQYEFEEWKLQPRFTMDIEGDPIPHYCLFGDLITMNDSRDILENYYLEIKGDTIIGIHASPPIGVEIIDVDGLIFPGLIDSHNHPSYNILGEIPFPQTFKERYEWQRHPMYSDFYDQYDDIRYKKPSGDRYTELWKIAEARQLVAGCTMIQGKNCNGHGDDYFGRQGMIIDNVERYPGRGFASTFPLNSMNDWLNKKKYQYYWSRFIIHLCEGINANAKNEFYTWRSWGMLDWRTTIIHGLACGENEWTLMANANAHLIWSPFSNWVLYNGVADVPGALGAGLNVALAPDWTESGMDNMLAEMKFAESINQDYFEGILTPQTLAEMVTRNAALAVGMEDLVGAIDIGYRANLMAIPGNPLQPYDDLLAAEPADVLLTVVGGRPLYGDPAMMDYFPWIDHQEDITICGVPKRISIGVDTHAIPDSDMKLQDIEHELYMAYLEAPYVCEYVSYDPCFGQEPTPTPTQGGPTATPTQAPTSTPGGPTATPTPTPTMPCENLGVTIDMPSTSFGPSDTFYLNVDICNPSASMGVVPLFVILDVYHELFFAPSFNDFDHYHIQLFSGFQSLPIIPAFAWPVDAGAADGILFYAGLTNPQITDLIGDYDFVIFGWYQ